MAAPDQIPVDPTRRVRRYHSPPRRPGSWTPDRPGELSGGQPSGHGMGSQGPDQGYVYKLTGLFDDELRLGRVHRADADAGCAAVALKRAAHYGRAPVVHDLRMAYAAFGFLDDEPDAELVDRREDWFAEVAHGHHYAERRQLADRVSVEALATTPEAFEAAYRKNWRNVVDAD